MIHQLGVKITAKSYEILSSNLYSDKITAIIRELSTNAVDSHILAGKADLPISITLPSHDSPYFVVQDYGVGLSKEQLANVFTYFESDKENDNRFTGEKGLGSKSPLAYTDSFSVISVYNGIQYTCKVFKNEQGIPCLDDEVEPPQNVDLPNGVRISVKVHPADYHDFEHKAKLVYSWFSVCPIISCEIPQHDFLIKADSYALYKKEGYNLLVMGEVAYPFEWCNITNIDNNVRKILNKGIVLFCERGQVDTVASRENLEYTNKTLTAIRNILDKLKEDATTHIARKFESCTTLWECCYVYKSLERTILGSFLEEVKPKWEGKVVKSHITVSSHLDAGTLIVERCNLESGRRYSSRAKKRFTKFTAQEIYPGNVIYLNDITRGAYTRIEDHLRSLDNEEGCYLLTVNGDVEKFKKFLQDVGLKGEIKLVSSLPQRERKARDVKPRRVSGIISRLRTNQGSEESSPATYFWENLADYDLNRGGIYVITSRNKPHIYQDPVHPGAVVEILRLLQNITGRKFKVHGVGINNAALLQGQQNWVPFREFVRKILKNHSNLDLLFAKSQEYTKYSGWSFSSKLDKLTTGNNLINTFKEKHKECSDASTSKVNSFGTLNNQFRTPVPIPALHFNLDEMKDEIVKKYPLLNHLSSEGMAIADHYVGLVDREVNA